MPDMAIQRQKNSVKTGKRISVSENRYGNVLVIRWDNVSPEEFELLKEEVKGWDWRIFHQTWNRDMRGWTISIDMRTIPVVKEFAHRWGFDMTPQARNALSVTTRTPAKQKSRMPRTYRELLERIG